MSTLRETYEALESFIENTKNSTDLYQGQELGKIFYSALLQRRREDGLVGFGPRDIWNVPNEELIALVQELEKDILSQAQKNK